LILFIKMRNPRGDDNIQYTALPTEPGDTASIDDDNGCREIAQPSQEPIPARRLITIVTTHAIICIGLGIYLCAENLRGYPHARDKEDMGRLLLLALFSYVLYCGFTIMLSILLIGLSFYQLRDVLGGAKDPQMLKRAGISNLSLALQVIALSVLAGLNRFRPGMPTNSVFENSYLFWDNLKSFFSYSILAIVQLASLGVRVYYAYRGRSNRQSIIAGDEPDQDEEGEHNNDRN
jgi:cytochrome bd-type quinol oxidase subunit 2